jgi:predicted ferric reductase
MPGLFKKNQVLFFVILINLLPVLIWYGLMPLPLRFADLSSGLRSVGQLSALLGTAMFACNFVLAVRTTFLDKLYGGLPRLYQAHHRLGGVAFILLLVHPIALALSYASLSLDIAAGILIPSLDNPAKNFGILSLFLLILLLFITFFWRPKYDIWKISHKFLGISFLLASLHFLLIPSESQRSPGLKIYLVTIASLGLISAIFQSVLRGANKIPYKVTRIADLSPYVLEIEIEPLGTALEPKPGQFAFIQFMDKNIGNESHPFSIASDVRNKNLIFIIKKSGDYTSLLSGVKPGTSARVEGPYGSFNSRNYGKSQVWIAGGIGITPFLSMLRSFEQAKDISKIYLYCLIKNDHEGLFLDEMRQIAQSRPLFRFFPVFTETEGRLSVEKISSTSGLDGKDFLICGPPAMMDSYRSQLMSKGVPKNKIITEDFGM